MEAFIWPGPLKLTLTEVGVRTPLAAAGATGLSEILRQRAEITKLSQYQAYLPGRSQPFSDRFLPEQ